MDDRDKVKEELAELAELAMLAGEHGEAEELEYELELLRREDDDAS